MPENFTLRKVDELKTSPPFNDLFPIRPETLDAVKADMLVGGYDHSQPIIVWAGRDIVIDGHTRLEAAKAVHVEEIPVFEKEFPDEDAAFQYAIHNQRDRRNLTDAELLTLVEAVDKRREMRRDEQGKFAAASHEASGKSAESTAQMVGVSRDKIEKTRTVLTDSEEKEAVLAGKKSINRASKDAKVKKKAAKEKPSPPKSQESQEKGKGMEKKAKEQAEKVKALREEITHSLKNLKRLSPRDYAELIVAEAVKLHKSNIAEINELIGQFEETFSQAQPEPPEQQQEAPPAVPGAGMSPVEATTQIEANNS